jgi:hypothetical protein
MNERDRGHGRRGTSRAVIGVRIGLPQTARNRRRDARQSRQKQKSTKIFLLPNFSTQIQRGDVFVCRDKVPVFTGVMRRVRER